MKFGLEIDLIKARPHKYIKRTGTPGNYKYWYKLPDGRIVEGDDSQQKAGRYEHALRLLVARKHGKHNLTNAQIAERTGFFKDTEGETDAHKRAKAIHRLNGAIAGMKKRAKTKTGNAEDWHTHGHDWEETHYGTAHEEEKEAVAETARETETPADESITPESTGEAATPRRASRPRAPRTTVYNGYKIEKEGRKFFITAPEGFRLPHGYDSIEDAKEFVDNTWARPRRTASDVTREEADGVEARNKAKELKNLEAKLRDQFGISFDEPISEATPEAETAPEAPVATSQPEVPAPRARRPRAPRRTPEQIAEQARALAEESGPDAPMASEVHAADPILATDDEPIRRMIEAQQRGENPYLMRAKEIFERTQAHMEPKMRSSLLKFFSVAEDHAGAGINAHKGSYDVRRNATDYTFAQLKAKMGTYHGVYMDMEEIIDNEPLNPEVERMKRGYARKQFERMKNYVKPSWHQANPDAPPPYPTFGDLQSWQEFGSRPSWVSPRAQLAIPREVFDAAPMIDGKVQLPPKWMPIHLMPMWNFAVKSTGRADYSSTPREGEVTGRGVNLPAQGDLNSHILNAMRKYIQGRGGVEQLIDIPNSKMTNNLSHEEIFKAMKFDPHNLSDSALRKIMKHKIIDPIAIAPYIKKELEGNKIKKSFQLVIDPNISLKSETLVKSEKGEDLVKSNLIKEIMEKKKAIKAIRIRG